MSSIQDTNSVPTESSEPEDIKAYFTELAKVSLETLRHAWQTIPRDSWDDPNGLQENIHELASRTQSWHKALDEGSHPAVQAYTSLTTDFGDTLAGRLVPEITQMIDRKIGAIQGQPGYFTGELERDREVCSNVMKNTVRYVSSVLEDVVFEEYNRDRERLNMPETSSEQEMWANDDAARRGTIRDYLKNQLNELRTAVEKDFDTYCKSLETSIPGSRDARSQKRQYTLSLQPLQSRIVDFTGYKVDGWKPVTGDQIQKSQAIPRLQVCLHA